MSVQAPRGRGARRPLRCRSPCSATCAAAASACCCLDAAQPELLGRRGTWLRRRPRSAAVPARAAPDRAGFGPALSENNLITDAFTPDRLAVLRAARQTGRHLPGGTPASAPSFERENSERRQAEAALRESLGLLRSIIDDAAGQHLWQGPRGPFPPGQSPRRRDAGRRARREVLGKTDYDVFPRETADAVQTFDRRVPGRRHAAGGRGSWPRRRARTYLSIKAPLPRRGRPALLCHLRYLHRHHRAHPRRRSNSGRRCVKRRSCSRRCTTGSRTTCSSSASLLGTAGRPDQGRQGGERPSSEIQNRVRAMALVHEGLYRTRDLASIRPSPYAYVEAICAHLYRSYSVDRRSIGLDLDIADVLDLDRSLRCGSDQLGCAERYRHGLLRGPALAASACAATGTARCSPRPERAWSCRPAGPEDRRGQAILLDQTAQRLARRPPGGLARPRRRSSAA